MPPTLKQIETFFWAARLGSFARTAQHLNATQSAVSMRIIEIEEQLQLPLFDRTQRTARLTPEGALLLPYAEEVLLSMERLMEAMSRSDNRASGRVRLGVTENVAVTWLADLMKALKRDHHRLQVDLEITVSHLLEDKLYSRDIDMALAACELPDSRFSATPLQSLAFRWMCSPELQSVPKVLMPESFAELPVLAVTQSWQARGSLLRWYTDNKVHFRDVTICNTFRTTASMAAAGLGIAHLPLRFFQGDIVSGRLRVVPCEPEMPMLKIFALRPLGATSPALRAIEQAALVAAKGYDDAVWFEEMGTKIPGAFPNAG